MRRFVKTRWLDLVEKLRGHCVEFFRPVENDLGDVSVFLKADSGEFVCHDVGLPPLGMQIVQQGIVPAPAISVKRRPGAGAAGLASAGSLSCANEQRATDNRLG